VVASREGGPALLTKGKKPAIQSEVRETYRPGEKNNLNEQKPKFPVVAENRENIPEEKLRERNSRCVLGTKSFL